MIPTVPPDVTASAVAYLKANLAVRAESACANARVGSKRTNDARQVVVTMVGGQTVADVRSTASLAVTAIAEDDDTACDLARIVAGLIAAWPDGRPVVRCSSVSLPFPSAEPSGRPEWSLTAELVVRGTTNL